MRRASLVVVALILFAAVCAARASGLQDELRTRVAEAINLSFPTEAEKSRKQLLELGTAAAPLIAETVQRSDRLTPIKKAFLIDVIVAIGGEQSNSALITLLLDDDPHVRGLAASYLGKLRSKASIPNLIHMLGDLEVYKTVVQTDPYREQDILIRDVTIESLQNITGKVLARGGNRAQQAKAWLRWWKKQQRTNRSCG